MTLTTRPPPRPLNEKSLVASWYHGWSWQVWLCESYFVGQKSLKTVHECGIAHSTS